MNLTVTACFLAAMTMCTSGNRADRKKDPGAPSNIILFIGDGMGLAAVSTTYYFGDQPPVFDQFTHVGLVRTSSASHKIPDSAASGTAMATGKKTYNSAIGVDTSGLPAPHITGIVSDLNWQTGVIATSSITHATPASFYAHVERRSMEEEIARQLIRSQIDFFAGGGIRYFTDRNDGLNLMEEAAENGFVIDTTALPDPGSLTRGKKYGYLLSGGGMPPVLEGSRGFLPGATSLAISHLSTSQEGFFLMVEGAQIDWAGHDNDKNYLLAEMGEFQEAIRAALVFAKKEGNTLVMVTADHETGGLALASAQDGMGGSDYDRIDLRFATGGHTATLVPLFAYGPGAETFSGTYPNTGIFQRIVELLD